MGLIERKEQMEYWNISHGALRKKANEGDPEAVRRTYKTKTGEEKTVHEIVKAGVSGYLDKVEIRDGKFGTELMIYIKDVEQFCIQMPYSSSYSRSFCEKLKNVDVSKEVEILPYNFTPKGKDKPISGVTLIQEGKKLKHYFIETDMDGNLIGWKDGYPHMEGDMDKDMWKVVVAQQEIFLKKVVADFPYIDIDDVDEPQEEKKDEKDDLPF